MEAKPSVGSKIPRMPRPSDVLDHDAVDFVRHVLQAVHHSFEVVENFRSHPEVECPLRPLHLKKTAPRSIMQVVCLTLYPGDLFRQAADLGCMGADRA